MCTICVSLRGALQGELQRGDVQGGEVPARVLFLSLIDVVVLYSLIALLDLMCYCYCLIDPFCVCQIVCYCLTSLL